MYVYVCVRVNVLCVRCRSVAVKWTERQTDGRTDGGTDKQSFVVTVEMFYLLCIVLIIYVYFIVFIFSAALSLRHRRLLFVVVIYVCIFPIGLYHMTA